MYVGFVMMMMSSGCKLLPCSLSLFFIRFHCIFLHPFVVIVVVVVSLPLLMPIAYTRIMHACHFVHNTNATKSVIVHFSRKHDISISEQQ
jgi:hypothetical protein